MYYNKPKNYILDLKKNKNKKNIDAALNLLNQFIFNLKLNQTQKEFFIILLYPSNLKYFKELMKQYRVVNISKISTSTLLTSQLSIINSDIFSFGFLVEIDRGLLSIEELNLLTNKVKGNLLACFNNSAFYWFSEFGYNSNNFYLHNHIYKAYLLNYLYSNINKSKIFDLYLN